MQPKAGPLPTWLPGGLYVCFFCDLFLSSFLCAHWSSYFFPFADGMVKAQLAHTGRCFILREVWVGPTPCFAVNVNACGLEYIRFQIRDIVVHRSLGHHCSMLALLGFLQNQILCGLRSIFACLTVPHVPMCSPCDSSQACKSCGCSANCAAAS